MRAKRQFDLLGPEAMGGHHARRGFRFQDRWIALHLLDWVTHDDFRGVVNEGVDDVDVSWHRAGPPQRKDRVPGSEYDWTLHQLKDTTIGQKSLGTILEKFRRKHADFPKTWSRCGLVATRCAEGLSGLPELLRQTRNLRLNHGPDSPIGIAAAEEFAQRLRKLRINTDAQFLLEQVDIEFSAAWVNDQDVYQKIFRGFVAAQWISVEHAEEIGRQLNSLVSEQVGSLLTRDAVVELLDRFRTRPAPAGKAGTTTQRLAPADHPLPETPDETRPILVGLHVRPDLSCEISVFPGGAVLLELPGERHGLIDCGLDAAAQIVPYLDARGVDTLDFVAISHWHVDRYNGVIPVVSSMKRVRELLVPSVPDVMRRAGTSFLDQLQRDGPRRHRIGQLVRMNALQPIWHVAKKHKGAGAEVVSFSPDVFDPRVRRALNAEFRGWQVNDLCTVFRVSVGDRSFLITADATIRRWDDLLARFGDCFRGREADGMTVPHHGSGRSLNPGILAALVEPSGFCAVLDPAPRFNLPHREALDLIRAAHGELLVCDRTPVHLLLTRDGLFERRFPQRKSL
jgi:beta-lactamase superfamily II metal-dependent hydrolase